MYKFETKQRGEKLDLICYAFIDKKGNFLPNVTKTWEWKYVRTHDDFISAISPDAPLEIVAAKVIDSGIVTENDKNELMMMCEIARNKKLLKINNARQ